MDSVLCDELLIEIFTRIPSTSSQSLSISLVSKRFLHIHRLSTTSLSLHFPPFPSTPYISSFLRRFPFLSSLSLFPSTSFPKTTPFDQILIAAASSCPNLQRLRFFPGPVSFLPLLSLSSSCPHLSSLSISLKRPFNFTWVASLKELKVLSLVISNGIFDEVGGFGDEIGGFVDEIGGIEDVGIEEIDVGLGLETLSVSGIERGDVGMGWLWRNCKKLRKLQLRSCEGLGEGGYDSSFSGPGFSECLYGLQEVELRTCRSIVDGVLERIAENCVNLESLLVYDGGSREGLLRFVMHCRANVKKLDLRLPLDLDNDHLVAVANKFRDLSVLRLQSCCLVTGEGLKGFSVAMGDELEELALMNCDVVERVPGLLATIGQNLRRLRCLDLSYNELLVDKELASMLVSCRFLVELKLRGCRGLTVMVVVAMIRSCKYLEHVDVVHCRGIEGEAIEMMLKNLPRLRMFEVDGCKLMESARNWAAKRCIDVVVAA